MILYIYTHTHLYMCILLHSVIGRAGMGSLVLGEAAGLERLLRGGRGLFFGRTTEHRSGVTHVGHQESARFRV